MRIAHSNYTNIVKSLSKKHSLHFKGKQCLISFTTHQWRTPKIVLTLRLQLSHHQQFNAHWQRVANKKPRDYFLLHSTQMDKKKSRQKPAL